VGSTGSGGASSTGLGATAGGPGSLPGVDVSLHRNLEVRLRVHEAVLGHVFRQAAMQLEATPVLQNAHVTLSLSQVGITPIVGGFKFECTLTAALTSAAVAAVGLEPHIRLHIAIPSSPLWIEAGVAHVRVSAAGGGGGGGVFGDACPWGLSCQSG
jgi:hypothetical protein